MNSKNTCIKIFSIFLTKKINSKSSLKEIFEVLQKNFLKKKKKPIRMVLVDFKKNLATFLVSYIYETKKK